VARAVPNRAQRSRSTLPIFIMHGGREPFSGLLIDSYPEIRYGIARTIFIVPTLTVQTRASRAITASLWSAKR